jgi:hypothetical protein
MERLINLRSGLRARREVPKLSTAEEASAREEWEALERQALEPMLAAIRHTRRVKSEDDPGDSL